MRVFDVLYDDAHLVVVDKAAGVLTVPTPKRERHTLVSALEKAMRVRPVVVHRLDRDTSGVLVFAKNQRVADVLMANWASHERVYDAVALGVMVRDEGTIRSRLVTDKGLQRRSSHDGSGEYAETAFVVKQRLDAATHVRLRLATGRRNQIRVHLAEAGHPLLGDARYNRRPPHPRWPSGHLALHASVLSFMHPVTQEPLSLEAPLPEVFVRFLRAASKRPVESRRQQR